MILDTALYEADRSELLRPSPNITTNRRGLPTAFKLFTGNIPFHHAVDLSTSPTCKKC